MGEPFQFPKDILKDGLINKIASKLDLDHIDPEYVRNMSLGTDKNLMMIAAQKIW